MYTGLLALQQQNLPLGGFAGLYKMGVSKGAFLLQKTPLLKADFQLSKFTRKGA